MYSKRKKFAMCEIASVWFWDMCERWKENDRKIFPCLHWKVVYGGNWCDICLYILWCQRWRKNLFKSSTSRGTACSIFALFCSIKLETSDNTSHNKFTKYLNQGATQSLNHPKYCHFLRFHLISRQISWDPQLPLSPCDFPIPSLFPQPSFLHSKILFSWNNITQWPVSSILFDFNGWEASNIVAWWEKKSVEPSLLANFRHGSSKHSQITQLFHKLSLSVFCLSFVFIGSLFCSCIGLLVGDRSWVEML